MKKQSSIQKKIVIFFVFFGMIFLPHSGYGEIYKGKNFQIDIPAEYKITSYNGPSEMVMFALHPDGASVSVTVQKNPFLNKEEDLTGEKRLKVGDQVVGVLRNRLWDYSGMPLVQYVDGDLQIDGDKAIYYFRWNYKAREPKEEYLELATYQYIEEDKMYTVTLAAWRLEYALHEKEWSEMIESFQIIHSVEEVLPETTDLNVQSTVEEIKE